MKGIFIIVIFIFLFGQVSGQITNDLSIQNLINNFNDRHYDRIIEKVYVHLNKSIFQSGETINLTGYLVELGTHQLYISSKILYVDLISSDGEVITKKQFLIEGGISTGSIDLLSSLNTGTYTLRAYTNWMKNFDSDYFFFQPIMVLQTINERPTFLSEKDDSLDFHVEFFPEGGEYVQGIPARIGFKATDKQGRSISLSGIVSDASGNKKMSVTTKHDGMGSFSFLPESGKTYFFETEWNGFRKKLDLPQPLSKGYVLRVDNQFDGNVHIRVWASEELWDSEVVLIGQCRGRIFFSEKIIVKKEGSAIVIPKSILPEGILQVTLFDSNMIPFSERLVCIKKQLNYSINIKTTPELLMEREKIELTIKLVDKDVNPIKDAALSIAINDADQVDKDQNDKAIDNYLLLSSDLGGNIKDPGYYFSSNSRDVNIDLDMLMLIHGWRRFTWQEIINNPSPEYTYKFENGLNISGIAYNEGKDKPFRNGMISILSLDNDNTIFLQSATDSNGRFSFNNVVIPENIKVVTKSVNKSGKRKNIDLEFNEPEYYQVDTSLINRFKYYFLNENNVSFNEDYSDRIRKDSIDLSEGILMEEVLVEAQKYYERSKPNTTIVVDEKLEKYTDIFQLMKGRIPGLQITGSGESTMLRIRGFSTSSNPYPLIIFNGIPMNAHEAGLGFSAESNNSSNNSNGDIAQGGAPKAGGSNRDISTINASINAFLLTIYPSDIERIEALTSVAATSIYGFTGSNGVILIYTKQGPRSYENKRSVGYEGFDIPGYNVTREFYSPVYETEEQRLNPYPDFRQTLFWAPKVKTDSSGEVHITFYNSDVCENLQIDIQGLTDDGNPIRYLDYIFKASRARN